MFLLLSFYWALSISIKVAEVLGYNLKDNQYSLLICLAILVLGSILILYLEKPVRITKEEYKFVGLLCAISLTDALIMLIDYLITFI